MLTYECGNCRKPLLSDEILEQHTFTMFKEYKDDKKCLKYVSELLCVYIAHIHDLTHNGLKSHGHKDNIYGKLL